MNRQVAPAADGLIAERDIERVQREVLAWGAQTRRDLPWRTTRDPWAVLVSEVMLQQTQVSRVLDRWPRFMSRFPTPEACAGAPLAEVLVEWQGMGYPRRARNLRRAAQLIADAGAFPRDLEGLLALPGVGPYTARAVLAFAYEADAAVVDTNVGRILARLVGRPLAPKHTQQLADDLLVPGRAWEWNQTIMDIGSEHCRPTPSCGGCPMHEHCAWSVARTGLEHGVGLEHGDNGGADLPDPAVGSAHVSKPQARFEGSDRQARGRLLAQLAHAPVAGGEAAAIMGRSAEQADDLVEALLAEGLISRVGDDLYLGS